MMAILMPPWRMTSAMRAYLTLFCSFFCARAVQKYLNVLIFRFSLCAPGSRAGVREDSLVRAELAEDRAGRDDSKTDPDAPDDTAEDGDDLVSEELQLAEADMTVSACSPQYGGRYIREGTTGRTCKQLQRSRPTQIDFLPLEIA